MAEQSPPSDQAVGSPNLTPTPTPSAQGPANGATSILVDSDSYTGRIGVHPDGKTYFLGAPWREPPETSSSPSSRVMVESVPPAVSPVVATEFLSGTTVIKTERVTEYATALPPTTEHSNATPLPPTTEHTNTTALPPRTEHTNTTALPPRTVHTNTTPPPPRTEYTTTPPPRTENATSDTSLPTSNPGLGAGVIAPLVIGILAFVGLLAGLFVWLCMRRKRKARSPSNSSVEEEAPPSPTPLWPPIAATDNTHATQKTQETEVAGDTTWALDSKPALNATDGDETSSFGPAPMWKHDAQPVSCHADLRASGTSQTFSTPRSINMRHSFASSEQAPSPIVEHDRDAGRMKVLLPPAYDPMWKHQRSEDGSMRSPSALSGSIRSWRGDEETRRSMAPVPRVPSQYLSPSRPNDSGMNHTTYPSG